jgi:hypothetical protein
MRKAFTAVAIAAVAGLALPAQAMADPAAPPAPESVPIEFLASFAPAIIGAAAGPADVAGGPQQALLDQARAILNSPGIPPEIKATLEKVITFLDGSGGGGPEIPNENAPVIAQFLYPTLGKGCISATAEFRWVPFASPITVIDPIDGTSTSGHHARSSREEIRPRPVDTVTQVDAIDTVHPIRGVHSLDRIGVLDPVDR